MSANYTLPAGHVLVLRTNGVNGKSTHGFRWPAAGPVSEPTGHGLYGLLWGQGHPKHLVYAGTAGAEWQVLQVNVADLSPAHGGWNEFSGKVRFNNALVVLTTTDAPEAVRFLNEHRPAAVPELRQRPVWLQHPGQFAAVILIGLYALWATAWSNAGGLDFRTGVIAPLPVLVWAVVGVRWLLARSWAAIERSEPCGWRPPLAPTQAEPVALTPVEDLVEESVDDLLAGISRRYDVLAREIGGGAQ